MRRAASIPPVWTSRRDALRMFLRGATVRSCAKIALVVGTWLSLMNQGAAIFAGRVPWVKVALNYATPFAVSSLGFLAARRRSNVERLAALLEERERSA